MDKDIEEETRQKRIKEVLEMSESVISKCLGTEWVKDCDRYGFWNEIYIRNHFGN